MDLEETKFALQELQSRYDFQTEELAALRQQLAQAQAACAALEQEEVRRIRHLNRLGTWAQQDPTGPMIADQIQQWVLAELKAALGSAYEATSWQPGVLLAEEGWLSPDEAKRLEAELKESKQEIAAIQTGIRNEFTIGELSDDVLQDFATFVEHHNQLEATAKAMLEKVERYEKALNEITKTGWPNGYTETAVDIAREALKGPQ